MVNEITDSQSVCWLHVCWGDMSVQVDKRRSDGQSVRKQEIGPLETQDSSKLTELMRDCDAVVLEIPASPFQAILLPHRNPVRNFLEIPFITRFLKKYWELYRFISRCTKPIGIFDLQDSASVAARFLPFFRFTRYYFKRELPKLQANVFLNTEPFSIEPWRNRGRYATEIAKLRPLSLAAGFTPLPSRKREKEIDVFWAGTVDNSPLRSRGVGLLKQLREEGYRVVIVEDRMEKEDFYDHIAKSWLTFCPDGNGWQCWRTFEVACLNSVPLLSYPTIWQDEPFRGGEHCFYYDPEGENLKEVIRTALLDKGKLEKMSLATRDFVVAFHTEASVYQRHITLLRGNNH